MRVFLDTNVLVAAFATRGLCADLLRMVLAEHELLSSATVSKELTRVLAEKIRVPEATVREIVAFLPDTPGGPAPVTVRDPDDAVILSEALALRADVLVTGDKDLLEVGPVPGIRILDPRGFWHLVRGEASWASSAASSRWPRPVWSIGANGSLAAGLSCDLRPLHRGGTSRPSTAALEHASMTGSSLLGGTAAIRSTSRGGVCIRGRSTTAQWPSTTVHRPSTTVGDRRPGMVAHEQVAAAPRPTVSLTR